MKYRDLAGDYALYFDWLTDIVGGEEWWNGYEMNLIRLFERKYYWRLPLDGNMSQHVIDLRAKAIMIGKILPIYVPNGEPSVLEVLVDLSIKIAYDIMYDGDRDRLRRFHYIFEI